MKPSEILSTARVVMDVPEASRLGLKDESVMRYIQRVKSKARKRRRKEEVEEEVEPPPPEPEPEPPEEEELPPTSDLAREIEDLNNATSHDMDLALLG